MSRIRVLAIVLFSALIASAYAPQDQRKQDAHPARLPSFAEPAISPDGSEIAFISGGDIWTVSANGGDARLLISHAANDTRPLYSPDGKSLAFVSNRTGNGDIYVLTFATGTLRRMTYDDGLDQLSGWSPDSQWLYFHNSSLDVAGMNDVYRVNANGGTPMQVTHDRYVNEFFAVPSPDGKRLAISAHGIASARWWRKGHSHIDQAELWLLDDATTTKPQRVTEFGAKDLWPMWSADGKQLYFISDRGGSENLWSVTPGSAAKKLTDFTTGRALWPNIAANGKTIVFERDFGIWKYDVASNRAQQVNITLRGTPAGNNIEYRRLTDRIEDFALSPDGKKVVYIQRGEVFAASAKDGGEATRLTNTGGRESQPAWLPDNRRVVYVSDRDGKSRLYMYDFADDTEKALTSGNGRDGTFRISPDGKLIAFQRDSKQVVVLELDTKRERLLATANLFEAPLGSDRPLEWSPDSKWLAFLAARERLFTNVNVVRATGGDVRPVSFIANVSSNTVSWSPDGLFILFDTSQRTENGQIARIDLQLRTPKFREDQFRDLFKDSTPPLVTPSTPDTKEPAKPTDPAQQPPAPAPATTTTSAPATTKPEEAKPADAPKDAASKETKKPVVVDINFQNIRQRLSLLPIGVDANFQTISPDGKWLAMIASAAGQENLYVYSLDELAKEPAISKQLTSTPGSKRVLQFTPDSKEIYYLEDGRLNIVKLEDQKSRPLAVTAEMSVDFTRERDQAFAQGWRWLGENFYDEKMHGLDWNAIRATYAPRVTATAIPDEMRRVMSLMIGELNASHTGINPPASATVVATGHLGVRFDRAEYENTGKLKITEVIELSPAEIYGLKVGEYLIAVDGKEITRTANLDQFLDYRIDKRVTITVAKNANGSDSRKVALKPVNRTTAKGLTYRAWVNANREYVNKVSGGKLGYVHMFDMGEASLNQLFIDLDAENHTKKGVVIDIRNNNGGFVNAYALDVLARRGYMSMTFRGFPTAPARTILGQRSLELPTILVTNQHSLSDAEDFTEGYRTLKLGKVVGEPTSGWIIYTSNVALIDGSVIRLPFIRITGADGKDMEMNPRQVDIRVSRPIGEPKTGKDSQLDTAVSELLKQLGELQAKQ